MAHDLRLLLRLAAGRNGQPAAVILDACTGQSTPESGAHAGYDGHTRRKGAKVQGLRQGFVLLPKRWVVERSLAWLAGSAGWHATRNGYPRRWLG
jgi:hypothetical protein